MIMSRLYSRSPPASFQAPWRLRCSSPAPEGWRVGKHPQSSPPPEEVYLEDTQENGVGIQSGI